MSAAVYGSMPRLDALLRRAAASEPQRPAVIFQGSAQSYAEVCDRARRFAGVAAAHGLQKGDRVAFWAANRPEFVEVLFGVSMLGAIAAPLDHWWKWVDAYVAMRWRRPASNTCSAWVKPSTGWRASPMSISCGLRPRLLR
jgi:acyl-CoA synthetase (AMP-forming)/AMP-acid ligase II